MDGVASQPRAVGLSSDRAIVSELILSRLPHCGPATYWALQKLVAPVGKILQPGFDLSVLPLRAETRATVRAIQHRGDKHPLVQQAKQDFDWLRDNGIVILAHDDDRYPELLRSISQPPPLLFVKGEVNNLFLPQLAMVGSRNPSPVGRENAQRFARQLSAMGFVVTSGLALGIDAASHRGALANNGPTIAVMGTGIDKVYPHSHSHLAREIIENGGSLVTEFPLGTTPQASHFPRRNRIISGMSFGVLVVEAAVKSGSLITARYALQHNREVFAIPGSIHNPVSRGCHALLREGAHLIESVADMEEHLRGLLQLKREELQAMQTVTDAHTTEKLPANLSRHEQLVLEQLDYDITTLDVLAQRTDLDPGTLLSLLMNLELNGWVEQSGGGYQRLPAAVGNT